MKVALFPGLVCFILAASGVLSTPVSAQVPVTSGSATVSMPKKQVGSRWKASSVPRVATHRDDSAPKQPTFTRTVMVVPGVSVHHSSPTAKSSLSTGALSTTEPGSDRMAITSDAQRLREYNQRLRQSAVQSPALTTTVIVWEVPVSRLAAAPQGQGYWMTYSSSKRHNSHCRWFKHSDGHLCGPNDGIACQVCGG